MLAVLRAAWRAPLISSAETRQAAHPALVGNIPVHRQKVVHAVHLYPVAAAVKEGRAAALSEAFFEAVEGIEHIVVTAVGEHLHLESDTLQRGPELPGLLNGRPELGKMIAARVGDEQGGFVLFYRGLCRWGRGSAGARGLGRRSGFLFPRKDGACVLAPPPGSASQARSTAATSSCP